jgi:hypothetical protein
VALVELVLNLRFDGLGCGARGARGHLGQLGKAFAEPCELSDVALESHHDPCFTIGETRPRTVAPELAPTRLMGQQMYVPAIAAIVIGLIEFKPF